MQNRWLFLSSSIVSVSAKKPVGKKDEQALEELNSAHCRSQAKCQLVQTSYIKRVKLLLFLPFYKHLIDRGKSVFLGESHAGDLGRVYRPRRVRSVLTHSVKILPCRPPARLIRATQSLSRMKIKVGNKKKCRLPIFEVTRRSSRSGSATVIKRLLRRSYGITT